MYGLIWHPEIDPLYNHFASSRWVEWDHEVGDRTAMHLADPDTVQTELYPLAKLQRCKEKNSPIPCGPRPEELGFHLPNHTTPPPWGQEETMSDTAVTQDEQVPDANPEVTEAVHFDAPAADPEAAVAVATQEQEVADPMPDDPKPDQPTDEAEASAEKEKKERRPRGWLEQDVKIVIDKTLTGEITVEDNKPLTPHRLARLVKDHDGLDEAPSSGAVAAVLNRWVELGFITVNQKPFSFGDYTAEGRSTGLSGLKEQRSEKLKAGRKAERDAIKAAKDAEKAAS